MWQARFRAPSAGAALLGLLVARHAGAGTGAATNTEQHESDPRGSSHHHRGGGTRPVAGISHRRELPSFELLGGELGDAGERLLEPAHQTFGWLDRGER